MYSEIIISFWSIHMAPRKGTVKKTPDSIINQNDSDLSVDFLLQKMKLDVLKNGKSDTKGVLARLEKYMLEIVQKLNSESQCINVINAGLMNHGKSSLFNSLLDSDVFKVNDVRETVVNRREQYKNNIFLTDTPGLEAASEDDEEAFNTYSRANYILFVHTLRTGEFHAKEVSYLKRLQSLFPGNYLSTHLGIVLTFADSYTPDEVYAIKQKIIYSLKEELGLSDIRFFEVSNSRYQKSKNETNVKRKESFLNGSGICEIRKFIEEYTLSWQAENRELKQGILKNCQKECADLMTSLKEPLNNRIQYFEKLKNQSCEVKAKFKKMDKEINKSSSMLAKKVQDLDKLIKKWKNDVERY